VALGVTALISACGDATTPDAPVVAPTASVSASYQMTAVILGPVSSDDDADLQVRLREAEGVGANLNFLRLTCGNGASREWGAGAIAKVLGRNRVPGATETEIVVHYLCPNSSRPLRLLADLSDDHGFHHQVEAAPFHPDWPGA